MNINKYIEQAYTFFTSLAKEVVKELKPDHTMMAEHHKERTSSHLEANKAIVDEVKSATESIVSAINDKEVVESVNISNLDELTQGIEAIIDTLKTELSKIDKEIVVKNDLSQLTALFKSGDDKKDLLKALKSIENKIKTPEITDYTLILDELVSLVEKIKPADLMGVEELLSQIAIGANKEFPSFERYTNKDRIKVELSDKQLAKMGGGTIVTGAGGNQGIIDALSNKATEETLQSIAGFNIPANDEIVLTYVTAGNGVGEIETVVYKLATVTLATLTLSYDTNNNLIGVIKS